MRRRRFLRDHQRGGSCGFTLVELLVVLGITGVLASLLLPALGKAKSRAEAGFCAANLRQVHLAWHLYSDDHEGRLTYNFGAADTKRSAESATGPDNWVNNVLNWELDPDNTNRLHLTQAALGRYLGQNAAVFRCPADRVVSRIQKQAGWTERVRSISMNAMVGDAGEFGVGDSNANNPSYQQFKRITDFPKAERIFVFVEEHPDSINDGYFLNKIRSGEWTDLPAGYHGGAGNLLFGDGHWESRRWRSASTQVPHLPDQALLPFEVPYRDREDFEWLMRRTTVYQPAGYSRGE